MEATSEIQRTRVLKNPLWLPWLGLVVTLPIGISMMGWGPCSGPDSTIAAALMAVAGVAGVGAAFYSGPLILRKVRPANWLVRSLGGVSLAAAGILLLIDSIFAFIGIVSLLDYLRLR